MKQNDGFWNDVADYITEMRREKESGTDRGLVLVTCGMLDELLRRLIAAFMIDDDKYLKEVFEGEKAPLGSWSGRTKVARALGLISMEEAVCLDVLRDIRNDYAHKLAATIDRVPPGTKKNNEFRLRKLYETMPKALPLKFDPAKPFKENFYTTVFVMISSITRRFPAAFEGKRIPVVGTVDHSTPLTTPIKHSTNAP